ncbi:MAG: HK97 gp10 family phage protein [Erysipelotrichaceae bacterium]|nr:HK97 gp10 family phage protein [Erysipelotrichaceae bacterium]
MAVKFDDYTIQVQDIMNDKINSVLEECAGEVESAAKRNSRVDTGQTKGSFQHHVDDSSHVAVIGSNYENAIWEEFGTGEYALKGNGRKGGWFYEDAKGDGHFTYGKKPSKAFWKAYTALKGKIVNYIQESLKGL